MRFGISPLTYDYVIEKVIARRGLDGLSEFQISDLAKNIAKVGYQHFEIPMDLFQIFPLKLDDHQIDQLKKIKQEFHITYSVHLPFLSIDLAGPNKFIRHGSINSMVDAYNSIIELEKYIEIYVLHPTGETVAEILRFILEPQIKTLATELFFQNSLQSIETFIEKTKINRNKLAIENIEFPFEATIKIINQLNTKLCLDTAHLLGGFSGKLDLLEIAKKNLNKTGEIHLQDYNDENQFSDHSALGTGKNFPIEFLNLLHKKDFSGPIVFELQRIDALRSIEYIKTFFPQIKLPKIKDEDFY